MKGILYLCCDRPFTWLLTFVRLRDAIRNETVLVVDNSRDFSSFCKRLVEKFHFNYMRVEFDPNKSKVERIREAVRKGILRLKKEGCRYLIQVDDDIYIPPSLISCLFTCLIKNPLVKCLLVMEDGRLIGREKDEVAGVTGIDLERVDYPTKEGCPVHFHEREYTLVEIYTFHLDSMEDDMGKALSLLGLKDIFLKEFKDR